MRPILLLDDVSSELDPTRTGAVYDVPARAAGQVFVTTTRPELIQTPGADGLRAAAIIGCKAGALEALVSSASCSARPGARSGAIKSLVISGVPSAVKLARPTSK